MPPHVIVCRHCKKPVLPADLRWRKAKGGQAESGTHALAVLEEPGLDSNRRRILVRRRVLVCLVGLTRWN